MVKWFNRRLCDDIDPRNTDDLSNLFSNLAGNFENVVQYNKDNREFEVSPSFHHLETKLSEIILSNLC